MSDIGATAEVIPAAVNGADTAPDLDGELHKIYERNHVTNGAERGDGGRFASTETPAEGAADPSSAEQPPQAGEGAGTERTEPTLADQSVPLPANMRGLESEWAKVPPDVAAKIAPHMEQLHKTLSTQGQQIAQFKPIGDFIEQNPDIFGRQKQDGSKVKPGEIFSTLIGHQRIIERDLIQGVLNIAGSYNVTPQQLVNAIAQRVMGKGPDPVVSKVADLEKTLPALVERRVSEAVAKTQAETTIQGEVSRWSEAKDKPFAKALLNDEATFVPFITMARTRLGDTAAMPAVLDLAYDMAVNADPDMRAKAAAAKAAAVPDPKKVAEARRATAVNVTSTSSGSRAEPSLDDKLRKIYRENYKG